MLHNIKKVHVSFVYVCVSRPKGGAHPPAAGLDPQLPSGGAEAHVAAWGPGQDVSAPLSQHHPGDISNTNPISSIAPDSAWFTESKSRLSEAPLSVTWRGT